MGQERDDYADPGRCPRWLEPLAAFTAAAGIVAVWLTAFAWLVLTSIDT